MPDSSLIAGSPAPRVDLQAVVDPRREVKSAGLWPVLPASVVQSILIPLLLLTLVRLAFAAVIPLTEDETYYRLWSQHLQLGYYDHPPMIAWWIRAGIMALGDTSLGARLVSVLAAGATSLAIYDLTITIGAGRVTARRAALWFQAMPMVALGGILATPDLPTTLFWSLALCCLARAAKTPSALWWLGAGAAIGLALLSKYSALFLGLGVALWLVLLPANRKSLASPWPWLAALLALAIFSGNLVWNADHHWVTFAKQFGRMAAERFTPRYLPELLIGQFLLISPLIAPFAAKGFAASIRGRALPATFAILFAATIAPFALYLLFHALHDRVQAHWPTPLYPSLAILAAVGAASARGGFSLWLTRAALPTGLAIGALGLLHLALPATDVLGARDPAEMVRGWPAFSANIETMRRTEHAAWIGTEAYGTTAELDNQPFRVPVVQLTERMRYSSSDSSWRADLTQPGLVVDLSRRINANALANCFTSVSQIGSITRGPAPGTQTSYVVFKVSGPRVDFLHKGCPAR